MKKKLNLFNGSRLHNANIITDLASSCSNITDIDLFLANITHIENFDFLLFIINKNNENLKSLRKTEIASFSIIERRVPCFF